MFWGARPLKIFTLLCCYQQVTNLAMQLYTTGGTALDHQCNHLKSWTKTVMRCCRKGSPETIPAWGGAAGSSRSGETVTVSPLPCGWIHFPQPCRRRKHMNRRRSSRQESATGLAPSGLQQPGPVPKPGSRWNTLASARGRATLFTTWAG